ncbi:hypothetical protein Rsub_11231 [Raphidocelis subcapitata]|uniref:Uncharacterized protein n=1 Tax=Raphidocelis subcapitata TaxID=307507 RepID=A0A2V0PLV1_9CHLO|nr:hypothetical protein Rsub_11231 [Raphidocelis subcapitata]|eukprot:GBF98337.1 hypothetical protein Rsub_11231 [Raphidocelis subcapitata]
MGRLKERSAGGRSKNGGRFKRDQPEAAKNPRRQRERGPACCAVAAAVSCAGGPGIEAPPPGEDLGSGGAVQSKGLEGAVSRGLLFGCGVAFQSLTVHGGGGAHLWRPRLGALCGARTGGDCFVLCGGDFAAGGRIRGQGAAARRRGFGGSGDGRRSSSEGVGGGRPWAHQRTDVGNARRATFRERGAAPARLGLTTTNGTRGSGARERPGGGVLRGGWRAPCRGPRPVGKGGRSTARTPAHCGLSEPAKQTTGLARRRRPGLGCCVKPGRRAAGAQGFGYQRQGAEHAAARAADAAAAWKAHGAAAATPHGACRRAHAAAWGACVVCAPPDAGGVA